MEQLDFQCAEEKDVSTILHFIKELAAYEEMLDEVAATEELLKDWISYRIAGDTLLNLAK